jgi:hypothetical protein
MTSTESRAATEKSNKIISAYYLKAGNTKVVGFRNIYPMRSNIKIKTI